MSKELITNQNDFLKLCDRMRSADLIAFDTEFVSEFTYQPELCLLQFATRDEKIAVDPYEVTDLSPWWDIMQDEDHCVIVHGGREEIRFCYRNENRPPQNLFDVQIAEGLLSKGFPLSYKALCQRRVGHATSGRETRTDWRRRPLTDRQIHYALEDVHHLINIYESQHRQLKKLGRVHWATSEIEKLVETVCGEDRSEVWMKLSGIHRLNRRELGIARELTRWREAKAASDNRPVRKTLRDDFIIDLAHRQPHSKAELTATRGMERFDIKKNADALIECIQRGLAIPNDELPRLPKKNKNSGNHDEHVLGRLLGLALANRCAEADVSMSLVGTTSDLRDFVNWHLEKLNNGQDNRTEKPKLAQGWRSEVCGELLSHLLEGKISIRVADPHSDHPMVFEDC